MLGLLIAYFRVTRVNRVRISRLGGDRVSVRLELGLWTVSVSFRLNVLGLYDLLICVSMCVCVRTNNMAAVRHLGFIMHVSGPAGSP